MTGVLDLDEVLRFDPLAAAEELTGHRVGDNPVATAFGFSLVQAHARTKENMLLNRDDTLLSNDLDRYLRIIEANGFEKLVEIPFEADDHRGGKTGEIEFFYAHRDGLLLHFCTHDGTHMNGGNVYYNWRHADEESRRYDLTSSGGYVDEGQPEGERLTLWAGDHDCREALIYKMDRLRQHGAFVTPWIKRPHIWLVNHAEAKHGPSMYPARNAYIDGINASKIAMLPAWVQEFIRPEEEKRDGKGLSQDQRARP